jgi:hypothetical protein
VFSSLTKLALQRKIGVRSLLLTSFFSRGGVGVQEAFDFKNVNEIPNRNRTFEK